MRRRVSQYTAKQAYNTLRIVAQAVVAGEKWISYSDLARRLGMPNDTGRGLGPILDEAALRCRENNLPDVSAVIVTKATLDASQPMPSEDSFDSNGYWPLTGIHRDDVPEIQSQVHEFDWLKIKQLKLEG